MQARTRGVCLMVTLVAAIPALALQAYADCVLPSHSWELELMTVEALDGLGDVENERALLGEKLTFVGSSRDKAHPDVPVKATLRSYAATHDGGASDQDWSISLVREDR